MARQYRMSNVLPTLLVVVRSVEEKLVNLAVGGTRRAGTRRVP